MVILGTLCGIMTIVIILLILKISVMRKSADEIGEGVKAQLKGDTNQLISISTRDKKLCRLATELNTELKQLRDERIRFQNGDMELRESITNISHDLRTPLTAICGYLDLLEKEEKSEQAVRYTSMISNRAKALKKLTEELFRYSTANTDSRKPVFEDISLNSAVESIVGEYYGALVKANITPEIHIPEKPVIRTLDREYLSRILGNIISNAVKYSDGDLNISLNETGEIRFTNTAEKLDSITVTRLFDRFFTVEVARGSTGLGLSIAKLLCQRLGGDISAEYENGKLTVVVRFDDK